MAPFGLVLIAAAIAAVTDTRSGRIPNALTLPLLAVGPFLQFYSGGALGLLASLGGILVCGGVPLFLFCRGAMGGGDVKLFAGIGAALGPALGLEVQMVAYIAAALYAGVVLLWGGGLAPVVRSTARLLVRANAPASDMAPTVRLGVFIFLACAVSIGHARLGFS